MTDALKQVYRELGYLGPLPGDEPRRRGGELEQSHELPPLDEPGLREIESLWRDQPEAVLRFFKNKYPLTNKAIHNTIVEARKAFDDPAAFLEKRQGKRQRGQSGTVPPELIQFPEIEIDLGNHRFEPKADALGWLFNTGYYAIRPLLNISFSKARFPVHTEFPSNFIYEMKDRQGRPVAPEQKVSVALFSDFGTGVYHSRYIAKHLAGLDPDYAIHLGDVYYAGRFSELRDYFTTPLEPVNMRSRLFALNANHEMYSGAIPYFDSMAERRTPKAGWVAQEQEGSYFCIWNKKYQIIGIDTAFHTDGRHNVTELNQWLGERLREGKSASPKRTNILLSPNEPYALGNKEFSALYHDLEIFVQEKLIDFWFWGNTHYCTLFDQSPKAPFIGSCIGHAGHPIYKKDVEKNHAKHLELIAKGSDLPPAMWVDLSPKFPASTNLRPDLANQGFCMLELEGDKIRLTYYDWLKTVQHQTEFLG
jgi:Calcineurin-like phosphoesterase